MFARRWFSSVYDKIRCRFGLFAAGMPAWMVGRLSVLVLSGMSFCLFVSAGCKAGGARMAEDLPAGLFQDGDLAFRRGTGLTSRVVLAADKSGAYSHVGILKWMDGKWHVIHAVPGEPDYRGDEDRVKAGHRVVLCKDSCGQRRRDAGGGCSGIGAAGCRTCSETVSGRRTVRS